MTSTQSKPVTHVVFGMSAAGSLKRALSQVACKERVVGLPDDLSFGPVNPADTQLRVEWIDVELGYENWAPVQKRAEQFWRSTASLRIFPIAWVSRRCTSEYCGFLEFVCRMGDRPFGVIDITDTEFSTSSGRPGHPEKFKVGSFGEVPPEQLLEAQLIGSQRCLEPQELQASRELWARLKTENAPLRVLGKVGLMSAPLNHFDEMLMSLITCDWQKSARVIGEALLKSSESRLRQCGDLLLSSRLHTLAENNSVEFKSDISNPYRDLVRLPGGAKESLSAG